MNKGFTLIELVVVIILLGVISAVALPKFIGLSRDARIATIENLAGTMRAAANMSYLKAATLGVEKASRSSLRNPPAVYINDQPIELKYGYPEAQSDEGANSGDIIDLLELSDEWLICYGTNCNSNNSSRVRIGYGFEQDDACYAQYAEPGNAFVSADKYGVTTVTDGC